jgi:hypothetical protein
VGNLSHQFARHPVKLPLKPDINGINSWGERGMVVDAGVRTRLCNWGIPATSGPFGHQRKTSAAIGLTAADHRSSRFIRDDAQDKKRKTMAMPLPCVGLGLE